MSATGCTSHDRPSSPLRIAAGGTPAPEQMAALTAAVTVLVEGERRAPADPTPALYRSRWRRAALLEANEVPANLKHDATPWGAH